MKILSMDIGGTFIKYGIFNNFELIYSGITESEGGKGGERIVKNADAVIHKCLQEHNVEAVAISTAGIVNVYTGEIVHAGPSIPNYKGINWKKHIKEKYNLESEVDNDVNCAIFGEYNKDFSNFSDSILMLSIGTGIGGGFINDGEVYRGDLFSALEVGYMNIDGHRFEDIASTTALIKYYENISGEKNQNGKLIFDLAKDGSDKAIVSIEYMIDNLCKGISNIIYILNPKLILLGGGVMEQSEYLRPIIEEKLKNYLVPYIYDEIQIEFAKNGNMASTYGALYHYYKMKELK